VAHHFEHHARQQHDHRPGEGISRDPEQAIEALLQDVRRAGDRRAKCRGEVGLAAHSIVSTAFYTMPTTFSGNAM
jgi:hypothetical protein